MMQKNNAQEEAIRTVYGQLLLVSCPGSGKTTTMLRRINHMIKEGVDPASILMVTFTEAAAKEMKKRFMETYGDAPVTFCTIHSLCVRIMHVAGLHSYHIMDSSEIDSALRSASSAIKHYFEDFKDIKNDIGLYKNTGTLKKRSEQSISETEFKTFLKAYENYKDDIHAIDFDDLLIYGKRILTENRRVLKIFRDKFKFLICDEYQDTNPIQKDILYLLAGPNGNLCVVGDDDQSIYGFRGAVPSIMLSFQKDFPQSRVIHMSTNYRSVPGIIEPASMLIRFNEDRFKKDISVFRAAQDPSPVVFDSATDRDGEMEHLAEAVKKYGFSGRYQSCAVLARTNSQLEQVAEVFADNDIPFSSKDVVKDIYEHWCFSDLCTYLKLAEGKGQMADFLRIANRPKRYISTSKLAHLPYNEDTVLKAMLNSPSYIIDGVMEYFYLMKKLSVMPFKDRVPFILNELGYSRFLDAYAEQTGTDVSLDAKCEVFIRDSAKFESLEEWTRYARKHTRAFHNTIKEHSSDGVILATMHRSKGLEWDHVFIIDCCRGIIPYERKDSDCDVEEERRLFYVACTRAKETLHVMSYRTKKGRKDKESPVYPSSFISEMKSSNKQVVSKSEQQQMRKDSVARALAGLRTDDLSQLKKGELVHHVTFGNGVIVSNRGNVLTIRFKTGVKMFSY